MKSEFTYEWNEAKKAKNLALHGVDFASIERFDWDLALTIDQQHDGEIRHLSYGPVNGRLHALVWTQRGQNIRLISFRKANMREIANYEKAIKD